MNCRTPFKLSAMCKKVKKRAHTFGSCCNGSRNWVLREDHTDSLMRIHHYAQPWHLPWQHYSLPSDPSAFARTESRGRLSGAIKAMARIIARPKVLYQVLSHTPIPIQYRVSTQYVPAEPSSYKPVLTYPLRWTFHHNAGFGTGFLFGRTHPRVLPRPIVTIVTQFPATPVVMRV